MSVKVQALARLAFGPGARLGLSPEQAAARAYGLREIGRGLYLTTAPVEFKVGEILAVEENAIPKALASLIEVRSTPRTTPRSRTAPLLPADAIDTPSAA